MKILLTGASSFTGCWFATTLTDAGHEVVATFTAASAGDYCDKLRHARVERVTGCCRPVWGTRFGDASYAREVLQGCYDLIACHGAYVTDYRSDDFNFARALANNTNNLSAVTDAIIESGGPAVLLTNTVFQGGAGAGSDGLPHFSAYGLSKALTDAAFEFQCRRAGLRLSRFVIPNPFGPSEEPRFTSYLVKNWLAGETPGVRTPDYVRDNIHVSLLARAYAGFAEAVADGPSQTYGPSGYIESQGAFAERFAREMAPRLGVGCRVDLAHQTEFAEPRIRVNTDDALTYAGSWSESAAWDELADYYLRSLATAGAT